MFPVDLREESQTWLYLKDKRFYINRKDKGLLGYTSLVPVSSFRTSKMMLDIVQHNLFLSREGWTESDKEFFHLCKAFALWDHIYNEKGVAFWLHQVLYKSLCDGSYKDFYRERVSKDKFCYHLRANLIYRRPLTRVAPSDVHGGVF